MILATNRILKIVYYFLFVILGIFTLISVGSYLSVYITFGKVPSSQDFTYDFVIASGKSFHIFPPNIGIIFILAYLLSIVFLIGFIPAVLLLKYFIPEINIHSKSFAILIFSNIIIYSLLYFSNLIGWYGNYVLD